MPQKHGPGCGCCNACPADYSDHFTRADNGSVGGLWTEDSGTWAISSNRLVCTSAGVIRTSHTDTDNIYSIVTEINLPTVGDIVRVIVGWTNASNHAYVSFERLTGGDVRLSIAQVQGGTTTTVYTTDTGGGLFTGTMRAKVCWHKANSRLAGEFAIDLDSELNDIFAYTYYRVLGGTYGNAMGLQAATIAGSEVSFNYFDVYPVANFESPINADCPYCVNNCSDCINGVTAMVYRLEFTGTLYDGTYFVAMSPFGSCTGFFSGIATADGSSIALQLRFISDGSNRAIMVRRQGGFAGICWASSDYDPALIPCMELDEVVLSGVSGPPSLTIYDSCTAAAGTIKVTAVT